MASPFRIFRRHQKALLIVAGVILMFVFVLEDSLRLLMGNGTRGGAAAKDNRPAPNAVAVRWNGGRLTNAELDQLMYRRRVINNFQRQVHDTGAQAEQMLALTTGATPRQLTVQPVVGPERIEEGAERDVVRVHIFAEAAREAGMTVSDEEIRRYLNELGRRQVTPEQMQQLIRHNQAGSTMISAEFIFNALREELLAHYYWNSHSFATSVVMPEQQWQDWLRVNDRVSIEAAAFPTESFLVDVKAPTDAELTAFYDKYKDLEPRPDQVDNVEVPSPNPGFRIPKKIEVQYVRADYDKLLAKVKSEITDEEVQKYYDTNKDPYYIKADTDLLDKDKAKEADKKPAGDADAKQEPADAKPAEADNKDAGGKDANAAGDKQPGQAPAGAVAPTTDGKAGAAPAAETKKSAGEPRKNIFQLAAFEQQTPADEAASTQPGSPQATAGAKTDSAKTDQAALIPSQPGAADSAQAADKQLETPKKPVEFLPLDDELKDKIRSLLATPKVNDRLNQLTGQMQNELTKDFNKYFRAVIDAKETKQPPPPAPESLTDLSGLAAKYDLEFQKVGPVSQLELRDDKGIGQVPDVEHSGMPLFYTLFGKDVELYKAISTTDVVNNRYIVVKTSETAGRVPPLDEIHDAVVKAWKFEQAAAAALKQAQDEAKKAQEAKTSLKEFFANDPAVKVVTTDQFAWLTGGEVSAVGGQFRQQPYRMSEPDDIVAGDQEFMKTVFDLAEGQVAAVLNHNHSTAYVLRVAEHQYTPEKLKELYLAEANMWLGQSAMNNGHAQNATQVLTASLLQDAGYKEERSLGPHEANGD